MPANVAGGEGVIKVFTRVLGAALVILIAGCGGDNTVTTPPPPPRILVSDNTSGTVNVVDARTDTITHTLAAPSPGKMVSAGGTTVIQSTLASSLTVFDNATETIRFSVALPSLAVDVAIAPDGKTALVAESNGTVQSINTTTGTIGATTNMAGVQRLVMGPQGLNALAFNDSLAINFAVVPSQSTGFLLGNLQLDHPANGVFPKDDNGFWVFDCGKECGGSQAGIAGVTLNLPGGPGIGPPLALSGATVGLESSGTTFVAGSPASGLNAGTLQVVNEATFTSGAPINIADGRHNLMVLTSNRRLYVGSTGCTLGAINAQNQRQGCLTIFDPATLAVSPGLLPATRPNGNVTALAPVSGRNVIYVVQGGKLDIFDINTNAASSTATPPNFPGTVVGAAQLSP